MSRGNLLTRSPLAPEDNVDPVGNFLFLRDHGAMLNIVLLGERGSEHDDTYVGSSLHTDHNLVANFLPAPVKNAYPRVCIRGCCT